MVNVYGNHGTEVQKPLRVHANIALVVVFYGNRAEMWMLVYVDADDR